MKKITVLIDFTETCYKSVEFAYQISKRVNADISLLHVTAHNDQDQEIKQNMDSYAALLSDNNVEYEAVIQHGSFFATVDSAVALMGTELVIVGTHGKHGIKQNLLGSNILKLVQILKVSTLVVQDNSVFPEGGFDKILFPVAPNVDFEQHTKEVADFAKIFNGKICLYTLEDHMESYEVEVQTNLKKTKTILDEMEVEYDHCADESTEFSVGYARQTLKFAEENHIPIISILSNLAKVNTYYGRVDKENILLNKHAIPVFCANDLV